MFTPRHQGGEGPPLLLLHGFTDTWRTWELVLPMLEREREVLAPTLAGHAGGPPVPEPMNVEAVVDLLEQELDATGWETAHVAGNSLGGFLALKLAERGRARSVVGLAPAGGWAADDASFHETLDGFRTMQGELAMAKASIDGFVRTPQGLRRATRTTTVDYEHLPPELIAHQLHGVVACTAVAPFNAYARAHGWPLDPQRVTCPLRIVWGTEDVLLPWPQTARRWQDAFPHADWVVLDDVGHAPQLDVPLEAAQLVLGGTAG